MYVPRIVVPLKERKYPQGFIKKVFCTHSDLYVLIDGRQDAISEPSVVFGVIPFTEEINERRLKWMQDNAFQLTLDQPE
jgi:hypothetical protein